MAISFDFKDNEYDEVDLILLNEMLKQLKKETKDTDTDFHKLTYDFTGLLEDYSDNQITHSLTRLFEISIIIEEDTRGGYERIFVELTRKRGTNQIIIEFVNVRYLKDNYFVWKNAK